MNRDSEPFEGFDFDDDFGNVEFLRATPILEKSNGILLAPWMFRLSSGCRGMVHKLSPKRLNRSVAEKHYLRDPDTLAQLASLAAGLAGNRLLRHDLIADDELRSRERS